MNVEIRKTASATITFGDHGRKRRQPAEYGLYVDGERIGRIYSLNDGRYHSSTDWVLAPWPTGRWVGEYETLKEAKVAALRWARSVR